MGSPIQRPKGLLRCFFHKALQAKWDVDYALDKLPQNHKQYLFEEYVRYRELEAPPHEIMGKFAEFYVMGTLANIAENLRSPSLQIHRGLRQERYSGKDGKTYIRTGETGFNVVFQGCCRQVEVDGEFCVENQPYLIDVKLGEKQHFDGIHFQRAMKSGEKHFGRPVTGVEITVTDPKRARKLVCEENKYHLYVPGKRQIGNAVMALLS